MKTRQEISIETLQKENLFLEKALAGKKQEIEEIRIQNKDLSVQIEAQTGTIETQTNIIEAQTGTIKSQTGTVETQAGIIKTQTGTIENQTIIIEDLKFQVAQFQRMLFGSKRERFEGNQNPNQLTLAFDIAAQTIEAEIAKVQEKTIVLCKKLRKPHPGRLALPSHLPVVEIVIQPKEDVTGMVCVGKDITDELEFTPSKLHINRYIRYKYITREDEKASQKQIIAELERPMPKCIAGPDLLANLVVDKYVYHLPIYRQLQRFLQDGIEIKSSTMDSWLSLLANHVRPLYAVHKSYVLGSNYLQVDESPIRVLDRDKPQATHQGYMWVYHAPMQNAVYFEYNKGRGQTTPQENLSGFKGFLQTDGYAVYEQFGQKPDIVHLSCWAHARRYFEKALENDQARAGTVMLLIQNLYAVEQEARDNECTSEQRYELRLKKSLPILNLLGKYMAEQKSMVLPKSPIGKAFAYCIARWDNLLNFLKDGNLEIDSNKIENAIRPLALGRKNYLFAGSHDAAQNIAMYYSFFASCKKHEIHPQKWLAFVIRKINDTKISELKFLLPQFIDKNLIG